LTRSPGPPHTPRVSEPRRERNAPLTKKRILDAAELEFGTRGFAGARLRDIAEAAGVQAALIHHYWGDKQGLYRAVIDRAMGPISTESWSLLSASRTLDELVAGFIDLLGRFYAEHQNLLGIVRHEMGSGESVLADVLREQAGPIAAAIAERLAGFQDTGEVRGDATPSELIAIAMGAIAFPFADPRVVEALVPGAVPSGELALERRIRTVTALVLDAIRGRSVAPPRPSRPSRPSRSSVDDPT
jgi:TetR/AcrR family transcriptional regulator